MLVHDGDNGDDDDGGGEEQEKEVKTKVAST